ncbi:MAG: hypothetical protein M3Q23_13530 [Actinomycetota bacterium]|nr:hypothetical protein [Actinomycetota bacterium]
MTERTATRLAWAIALACAAMVVATLVFLYLDRTAIRSVGSGDVGDLVPTVTVGALGALVAFRRPANAIGWLLLGIAAFVGVSLLAGHVAMHALLAGVSSHGWPRWWAWLHNWVGNLSLGLLILLLLLFPSGKPLSKRWRWVTSVTVLVSVWFVAAVALDPAPVQLSPRLPRLGNPIGIKALAGFANSPAFLGIVVLLVMGVAALLLRLRRSRGEERQQLKWFAFAAALSVGLLVVAIPLSSVSEALSNAAFGAAFTFGFAVALPGAAALAILRYGLYEIDVIINRTLVYGALTALLAGVYVGGVFGLGAVARSVSGGKNNSLVVAVSTLAVAALFRPARRWVQAFIDRRFYRRKYDAARTLEAFSARLRQEVDLNALQGHLISVVHETMQPARVSLWLRAPTGTARP